jgi:Fic family protein
MENNFLYKNGFDAGKYISFEEQINNGKSDYYAALRLSSDGWHDSKNSYFPFIENFITTLLYCYKELDKRFAAMGAMGECVKLYVPMTCGISSNTR